MPVFNASSRCSGSRRVDFRWYGDPPCAGDDLEAAVEVLFASISKPGRVWSPQAKIMAKAEFRQRIKKASEGRLRPVDEVKAVDIVNPPPLYEIRWQHIPVTERDGDGAISHQHALVRMYHSEPDQAPDHFIGHHAHEKLTDVADINEIQQREIRAAIGWHRRGIPTTWGIEYSQDSDIEFDL